MMDFICCLQVCLNLNGTIVLVILMMSLQAALAETGLCLVFNVYKS